MLVNKKTIKKEVTSIKHLKGGLLKMLEGVEEELKSIDNILDILEEDWGGYVEDHLELFELDYCKFVEEFGEDVSEEAIGEAWGEELFKHKHKLEVGLEGNKKVYLKWKRVLGGLLEDLDACDWSLEEFLTYLGDVVEDNISAIGLEEVDWWIGLRGCL